MKNKTVDKLFLLSRINIVVQRHQCWHRIRINLYIILSIHYVFCDTCWVVDLIKDLIRARYIRKSRYISVKGTKFARNRIGKHLLWNITAWREPFLPHDVQILNGIIVNNFFIGLNFFFRSSYFEFTSKTNILKYIPFFHCEIRWLPYELTWKLSPCE
jgi:hypothetical protein